MPPPPSPPLPPLVWQTLELPFRGGLSEAVADEVLDGQGVWLGLQNVRYTSHGVLVRRPGFAAMGATGLPYVADSAAVCGREALVIGAGLTGGAAYVDPAPSVYRYSENKGEWYKSAGQVSPASLIRVRGARVSQSYDEGDPCIAVAVTSDGKYQCQVWRNLLGATDDLYYKVIDLETGTVIVNDTLAQDRIGSWCDVIACGTSFWLVYLDTGDTTIACRQLPTSTLVLAAEQTIAIASVVSWAKVDATPESSTYFDVVAVDDNTPSVLTLYRVNATATIAVTSQNLTTALAAIDCVACNAVSGSPGRLGYAYVSNAIVYVGERTLNPPTWATPWVDQVVDNTFVDPLGVGIVATPSGDWCVVYDGDSAPYVAAAGDRASTYTRTFNSSGTARGASRYAHWTALCSKPFTTADGTFVWLRKVSGTSRAYNQPGVILVTLTDSYTATDPLVPVGHACIGDVQFDSYVAPGVRYYYNVRTDVVSGVAYTPQLTRTGLNDNDYMALDVVETRWSRPLAACNQYVESQGTTNLCGSVLASYDGTVSHEHGFLNRPWMLRAIVGAGGSGNIEGDASNYRYSYVAVYVWDDERGNRWFSQVSDAISIKVDAAHNNCNCVLYVSSTPPTSKHQLGPHRKPKIYLYRTQKNASTYYYVGEVIADWTSRAISYTDNLSDASIATRPTLYTTGGVLESWAPPSSRYVHSHGGRLWSISGDDDRTVWASRVMVAGEAPAWSPLLTLRLDDAPTGAVALASLDEKLVVFCKDRIYVAVGAGPNDAGAGEPMPTPQLVSSDAGCIEPRSVVSTAAGVWFLSRSGLCLLTRKLEVVPAGAAAQQTLSSKPDVIAAIHDAERSSVFWLLKPTGGASATLLVHDYQHDGAWMTWTVPTPSSAVAKHVALVPGTTVYGNSSSRLFYVYASAVHRENEGAKDNLDGDATWITPTIETPWLKVSGINGYQRVKELLLTLRAGVKHKASATVYVNHDDGTGETYLFDSTVTDDDGYTERLVGRLGSQKCRSIKIVLSDSAPTGTVLSTWGVRGWLGLALRYGVRSGTPKVHGANRV